MTTELVAIDEIEITATPAVINFDYEALNARADAELEKYQGYVVTEENLAADKKHSQEAGSLATKLNNWRLSIKRELSAPITEFEKQINEVRSKFTEAKALIDDQVKVFEAEKLRTIRETIRTYFADQTIEKGIRAEYADFADVCEKLTMLSALTAKGNLTAKTSREADEALNGALNKQNTADLRIAQLETECLRRGLKAPLTEAHVKHILHDEEGEYREKLKEIIEAEMGREAEAVAAHRAEIEREAKAAAEAEARARMQAEAEARRKEEAQKQAESLVQHDANEVTLAQAARPGHETVAVCPNGGLTVVTCTFHLDVSGAVPSEAIEAKFKQQLEAAGFTTLTRIDIKRP